jgi:hypothetical protein
LPLTKQLLKPRSLAPEERGTLFYSRSLYRGRLFSSIKPKHWQAAEKGFLGHSLRNIDSKVDPLTQERFVTDQLWILMLRIAVPISTFSAAC